MVRLSERLRRRRPYEASIPAARASTMSEPKQAPEVGLSPGTPRDLHRELTPGELAREANTVSRLLYERLGEEEVEQTDRLLWESEPFAGLTAELADPGLRRMLALHCGMWHRLEAVPKKTRLHPDQPPENVHAMARGPLAAAGGLYEADLVADALRSAGIQIAEAGSALDFGCSSGRVVRVLAAAYPGVRWQGCDPNRGAIAWAREHLPEVEFFFSGDDPPLALDSGSVGLGYGISIWSHFEPRLGLEWFEEMRRLLVPGGHLVMTTHGLTSVAYYAANGERTPEQCEQIADALYRRGWWYAPEFGAEGDWGVLNPNWGTAFLSPEWLLTNLCPGWRILEFAPGRNAGNQDVYVLERA